MNDTEFLALIDSTFSKLEELIEASDMDIDTEHAAGILSLTFPNKTQIVLTKQTPLHQLWLAGLGHGYHFDYVNERWICNRTQQDFKKIFNDLCSEAAGEPISFEI